jgi:hypothetical protein
MFLRRREGAVPLREVPKDLGNVLALAMAKQDATAATIPPDHGDRVEAICEGANGLPQGFRRL